MNTLLRAELLLNQLLGFHSFDPRMDKLNVLVVCAGVFPSFFALRKILLESLPQLQFLNFTLIEPAQFKTELFIKEISNKVLDVNFDIQNKTLATYMEKCDKKFDIIYFEHPDLRTLTIVLSQCLGLFKNSVSLRESIAHISDLCKPHTFIIASMMSNHENKQFYYLLKYLYQSSPFLVKLRNKPGGFNHGLYAKISAKQQKSKMLKISDRYLTGFTLFFILSEGYILAHARSLFDFILPIVLIWIAFQYYRPGKKGLYFLILLQVVLLNLGYFL